jgi:hypothetical protein
MANRAQLRKLDDSLRDNSLSDKILIEKRGLYFYYNKPNRIAKKLAIHAHFCGECKWGTGKQNSKEKGVRGVWIGPFETTESILDFVEENFGDLIENIEECSCLNCK